MNRMLADKTPADFGIDVEHFVPRRVAIPRSRRFFIVMCAVCLLSMSAILFLGNWAERWPELLFWEVALALVVGLALYRDIRNAPMILDAAGIHVPGFRSILWRECGPFDIGPVGAHIWAVRFNDLRKAQAPRMLRVKIFAYPTGMTHEDTCTVFNLYRQRALGRGLAPEPPLPD